MGERYGVLLAILSSCLGGTAAAVTRYLVTNADPITLAILRWGIGFLVLMFQVPALAGAAIKARKTARAPTGAAATQA